MIRALSALRKDWLAFACILGSTEKQKGQYQHLCFEKAFIINADVIYFKD